MQEDRTGQNLWIFCGWLSAPRIAWLVRHHHGSRRFRVSRVGSSVPGSVCEHATGSRTEQRWRVRPWASATWDAVLWCMACEAVHATLQEALRVSRPGGTYAASSRE